MRLAIAAIAALGLLPSWSFATDADAVRLIHEAGKALNGNPTPLEFEEIHRKLDTAIKLDPNDPEAYYTLARFFTERGYIKDEDYRRAALIEAEQALNDAIRVDPRYGESFVYLGFVETHLGNYAKAREAFDRAHALGWKSIWLRVNESQLDHRQGDLKSEIALLESAVSSGTHNRRALWWAHAYLTRAYCETGDRKQADITYVAHRRLFPDDSSIPQRYALALIENFGDFDAAVDKARDAVRLDGNARTRHALALALYAKWARAVAAGNDSEAIEEDFDEAEAIYPLGALSKDPELDKVALKIIPQALESTGRFKASDSVMQQALKEAWHKARRQLDARRWSARGWIIASLSLLVIALSLYSARSSRRAEIRHRLVQAHQGSAPDRFEPMSLRFTGTGSEYFGIWIVNLVLSVATLGIYSGWAKARKLRYFYRNTELAGSRFDYHGNGLAILKGRVVAVVLLIAYHYAFGFPAQSFFYGTMIVLGAVLPWLIRNSFRFRLRNSSWRGIRFGFRGSLAHAYYVFFVGGIGSVVSSYALAPFFHQRMKAYQHGNAWFGQLRFSFSGTVWSFYKIYLVCFACLMIAMTSVTVGVFSLMDVVGKAGVTSDPAGRDFYAQAVILFFAYAGVVVFIAPLFNARLQNLIWNNTKLGEHRFVSTLSARALFWIYLSNLAAIAITAGLFMPWASTRLARYRAESLTMIPAASLDSVVAADTEEVSAAGQETTDFFDLDIAF